MCLHHLTCDSSFGISASLPRSSHSCAQQLRFPRLHTQTRHLSHVRRNQHPTKAQTRPSNIMTVFANKDAFLSLGVEQITSSASHTSQDCFICTKPLAVHANHNSPQSVLRGYHTAVRITVCGHTHGEDCLNAWLDIGNSCPTCNRILFEIDGDPITQADLNDMVYMLGPELGEARVMIAVVAVREKREREQAALRRFHEQEIAKQKMEDTGLQDQEFGTMTSWTAMTRWTLGKKMVVRTTNWTKVIHSWWMRRSSNSLIRARKDMQKS
jgi:hypothetical protein